LLHGGDGGVGLRHLIGEVGLQLVDGVLLVRDGVADTRDLGLHGRFGRLEQPRVGILDAVDGVSGRLQKPAPVAEPRKAVTPAELTRSVDSMVKGLYVSVPSSFRLNPRSAMPIDPADELK